MSKVINLNRFRKEKTRADKRAKGDVNSAKFGRTKAEKQLTEAQREKDVRSLDGHKRDRDGT
ncbi:DUF4169 family protein [Pseudooceanicola onchidii]|uniref:DUF4169 family protein n=1 Tax=Pseudooceanicola onchidii TaxID=2562279 RepID=UPI0010AABBFA|nr:DUF4169 family protein [Pseudooceanicola onchidii]